MPLGQWPKRRGGGQKAKKMCGHFRAVFSAFIFANSTKMSKTTMPRLLQAFLFTQLFHLVFTNSDEHEPQILQLNIGAVFREHEDAHLAAAFNFTLHWLLAKQRVMVAEDGIQFVVRINGHIETMGDADDHYELLEKACRLINERNVIALVGPSDRHLSEQLVELTNKMHLPFFSFVDPLNHHHLDPAGNILPDTIPTSTHLAIFPQTQLLEALNDLIKYWRWHRLIVVYVEPERIRRLVLFLENDAFASIRFHLVHVEDGDHLGAAKTVKELEECDQELASSFQRRNGVAGGSSAQCSEFSRLLLDMGPRDTHQFLLAALKVGLVEQKHWFLSTSLDLRQMDMELFRHNHARFVGLSLPIGELGGDLPIFGQFLDHVRAHWLAKNVEEEGRINFRMSEAILLFDSLFLLSTVFNAVNQPQKSTKSPKSSANFPLKLLISSASPARCPTGTQPNRPLENGQKLAKMLRTNRQPLRGMGGELAGRFHQQGDNGASSNFTFRINLMGYAGQIEDIGYWQWDSEEAPQLDMSGESRAQRHRKVKVSDELKPHFRVTTILERPYVMLKSHEFEHPMAGGGGQRGEEGEGRNAAQFEGFCIDLLMELANDLGFTYTIHVVRDNKYGSDNGNGSWDGMIGEILHNQADMAVAPLTANFRRAEVVDFTKPFLSLGISIIFRIPEDYQPDIFSFLNPLSLEIWLCILLSIGGLTIGMYLVANVTPYEWNLNFSCCTAHQPHPAAQFSSTLATSPTMTKVELSNNYSFWNTLWYVMSTMLKGGCDFGPRAVSTRLLGGSWWVFTLVIVSAYTANLAAVLTVSRPHIPIRNIDDLANQSDISYGTINGGSTMQFFQESKIAAHAKMWARMHRSANGVFVRNNREGVEKVLREKYAFLMESSSLEYEVQQNCNLTQIGGVLGSKGYGIALQKNSEWTDRISRQILLYQKRGIVEMKKTKWWRSKGASCHGVGSSVKQQRISLNLQNVSGLFVILSLGLLLSVFIVAMEFYVRAKEQRQLFKNNNNNQQDGADGQK